MTVPGARPKPSRDEPFETAIQNAHSILSQDDDYDAFSPAAFKAFEGAVSDYVRSLASEAERSAVRQKSDLISSIDVQQAARYLAAGSSSGRFQYLSTVGGILAGAALSNALAIFTSGHPHTAGVLITVLMLVMGCVGIAFDVGRNV